MRTLFRVILPVAGVTALGLAGCNAGRSAVGGAEQVSAGFAAAASAPLEDFNLRRQMIPTVLLQAEANPYDLRNLNQCTTIGAEVGRLDEALGPDTDEPPRQDGSYLSERAADAAATLSRRSCWSVWVVLSHTTTLTFSCPSRTANPAS